jgi:ADP-heptose:LPS heptosyltransferase
LTETAVIQAKRGIGDVIWHLPFVLAIAAVSPGGQVTFMAPPTSGAHELLTAEPVTCSIVPTWIAGAHTSPDQSDLRVIVRQWLS